MELRQNQQTSLQLLLSPHMRLSIDLLQTSRMELLEKLQDAYESNPFLENESPQEKEFAFDGVVLKQRANRNNNIGSIEKPEPSTLTDVLIEQLIDLRLSETEQKICHFIIKNLDENGRIQDLTTNDIADICHVNIEQVENCILKLQQLEPLGCATFSAEESLFIQAIAVFPNEILLHQLINEHLKDVAENKLDLIAKKLAVSKEQIEHLLDLLRMLHPNPGLQVQGKITPGIIPDIIIDEEVSGGWSARYNQQGILSLYLDEGYLKKIQSANKKKEDQNYISSHLHKARSLLKAIELRTQTLLRIAKVIIDVQKRFFIDGVMGLFPLSVAETSLKLNLHISTISRAIRGKYLSCKQGVFELSYFFQQAINSNQNSTGVSVDKIKHFISNYIANEDKKRPKTDTELMRFLQNELKIVISRRTVAKYREQLFIPGSFERKRNR